QVTTHGDFLICQCAEVPGLYVAWQADDRHRHCLHATLKMRDARKAQGERQTHLLCCELLIGWRSRNKIKTNLNGFLLQMISGVGLMPHRSRTSNVASP